MPQEDTGAPIRAHIVSSFKKTPIRDLIVAPFVILFMLGFVVLPLESSLRYLFDYELFGERESQPVTPQERRGQANVLADGLNSALDLQELDPSNDTWNENVELSYEVIEAFGFTREEIEALAAKKRRAEQTDLLRRGGLSEEEIKAHFDAKKARSDSE